MDQCGHGPCMLEDTENCSITDMSQRSFASAEYAMKKKRTRREKFLGEMERIVPWARLIAVIEPLYPKSGRVGRQPIGVPKMLRMYCLQQWYGLADEALEDALYDSQSMRDFVGIDLSRESVADGGRVFVRYGDLLDDWVKVVMQLGEQLEGLPGRRAGAEQDVALLRDDDHADRRQHAVDIVRFGLGPDHDHLFIVLFRPGLGNIGVEGHYPAGGARRNIEAGGQLPARLPRLFDCGRVELGM